MNHVVITGGTRGIGFGLVREFLNRGYNTTFCGTTDRSVMKAASLLNECRPSGKFRAVVCDVSKKDELKNLWDFSTKIFGNIDIWINNAGISNKQLDFHKLNPDEFIKVIDINIKGMMYASHLVFNMMKKQGNGSIYNMGGLGSRGRMIRGLSPYGTSKRAVQYFTMAFAREIQKEKTIRIGLLLPGMVLTDMLLEPLKSGSDKAPRLKRLYNLLADEVEPVASYMTDRIVADTKNGTVISYTNRLKMIFRIPGRFLSGRDIVSARLNDPES